MATPNPEIGEELLIECIVEGTPTPTVEWLRDNLPLSSTDEIAVFISDSGVATVRIDQARLSDNVPYTCIASNVAGAVNRTISITSE